MTHPKHPNQSNSAPKPDNHRCSTRCDGDGDVISSARWTSCWNVKGRGTYFSSTGFAGLDGCTPHPTQPQKTSPTQVHLISSPVHFNSQFQLPNPISRSSHPLPIITGRRVDKYVPNDLDATYIPTLKHPSPFTVLIDFVPVSKADEGSAGDVLLARCGTGHAGGRST